MTNLPAAQGRPPRKRRRALALIALSGALLASVGAWLANSGVTSATVSVQQGAPPDGSIAAVDTSVTSPSVTKPQGAAQTQAGIVLAKVLVAQANANDIRVNVSWTDAVDAAGILRTPNVQISIGLYHTVHSGDCSTSVTGKDVLAPYVNLTEGGSTYCAVLDETATGSPTVSSQGKLLITKDLFSGYLIPGLSGTGAGACASGTNDAAAWCNPATVTDSNQRALFVIASITTPGGIPSGQQGNLSTLNFFIQAGRA